MSFRRVALEFEARLQPTLRPEAAGGRGKVEWKRFGSGEAELEVRVRLPEIDHGEVELRMDGAGRTTIRLERGRANFTLSAANSLVPEPLVGDRVSVQSGEFELLVGRFRKD